MILVSFCTILNGLSDEINLFWRCSSPLKGKKNVSLSESSKISNLEQILISLRILMWQCKIKERNKKTGRQYEKILPFIIHTNHFLLPPTIAEINFIEKPQNIFSESKSQTPNYRASPPYFEVYSAPWVSIPPDFETLSIAKTRIFVSFTK